MDTNIYIPSALGFDVFAFMNRFLLVVLSVSYLENIGVAVFPGEDGIHGPLYALPVPGDLAGVPLVYTLTVQSVMVFSWKDQSLYVISIELRIFSILTLQFMVLKYIIPLKA